MPVIRILVADAHPIVRYGLRLLMAKEPDMAVVGEAASAAEVVAKVRLLRPAIILLDVTMPQLDGLAVIRQIKQENPKVHLLILTAAGEDHTVLPAIQAGAQGYLSKTASPDQLLQGIRAIHQGQCPLDPAAATWLIKHFNQPVETPPFIEPLTKSEKEILRLVAQGYTNREIAKLLTLSDRTVGNHVGNILSKLQLTNRTQATLYALHNGLASLRDQGLSREWAVF